MLPMCHNHGTCMIWGSSLSSVVKRRETHRGYGGKTNIDGGERESKRVAFGVEFGYDGLCWRRNVCLPCENMANMLWACRKDIVGRLCENEHIVNTLSLCLTVFFFSADCQSCFPSREHHAGTSLRCATNPSKQGGTTALDGEQ